MLAYDQTPSSPPLNSIVNYFLIAKIFLFSRGPLLAVLSPPLPVRLLALGTSDTFLNFPSLQTRRLFEFFFLRAAPHPFLIADYVLCRHISLQSLFPFLSQDGLNTRLILPTASRMRNTAPRLKSHDALTPPPLFLKSQIFPCICRPTLFSADSWRFLIPHTKFRSNTFVQW